MVHTWTFEKSEQEKLYLEKEIRSEMNFDQIIGESPALRQVLELVQTVAPGDSTVLLLGETGTRRAGDSRSQSAEKSEGRQFQGRDVVHRMALPHRDAGIGR